MGCLPAASVLGAESDGRNANALSRLERASKRGRREAPRGGPDGYFFSAG